jgi:hypothetical protein
MKLSYMLANALKWPALAAGLLIPCLSRKMRACLIFLALIPLGAQAAVLNVSNSDQLHTALNRGAPGGYQDGDTIILAPGDYILPHSCTLSNLRLLAQGSARIAYANAAQQTLPMTAQGSVEIAALQGRLLIEGFKLNILNIASVPTVWSLILRNVDMRSYDSDWSSGVIHIHNAPQQPNQGPVQTNFTFDSATFEVAYGVTMYLSGVQGNFFNVTSHSADLAGSQRDIDYTSGDNQQLYVCNVTSDQPLSGGPVTELPCTPPIPATDRKGDMNCDTAVNTLDINPFVLALTNPQQYAAAYPGCNVLNGDINGDGLVTLSDINPFIALLGSGGQELLSLLGFLIPTQPAVQTGGNHQPRADQGRTQSKVGPQVASRS